MKNLAKGIGLVIALTATSAQAIPTLHFDGVASAANPGNGINFDGISKLLSVSALLTNTVDINPAPNLTGSNMSFSATLDSVDTSSPFFTVGNFIGVAGNDITIVDGDNNTLLTGEFTDLSMRGVNNFNRGVVSGTLQANGGSLMNLFGTGNLIALEFNLDTVFSANMYDNTFSGEIDGRIEGQSVSVPEPFLPGLFGLGLAMMTLARRQKQVK